MSENRLEPRSRSRSPGRRRRANGLWRRSLVVVGSLLAATSAATAATITVNTLADEYNDDGDCSLREAVVSANEDRSVDLCSAGNGPDQIVFHPAVTPGTIVFALAGDDDAAVVGDLDILDDLRITGAGASETIIDGNRIDRVFHVVGPHVVEFEELTIRNGETAWVGGGIYGEPDAYLGIVHSRVEQNAAAVSGGGVYAGGPLNVETSTIANNLANEGAGIWANDAANLLNCSVIDNYALINGGGLMSWLGSSVDVTNTTFHYNYAQEGRGGGIYSQGFTTLVNVTITYNHAREGGGTAHLGDPLTQGWIRPVNTVLDDNYMSIYPGDETNCWGTFDSQGHNFVGSLTNPFPANDCPFVATPTDLAGPSPFVRGWQVVDLLTPGGQYVEISPDSLTIDNGDGVPCLPYDQIFNLRPLDGDMDLVTACDIGATEFKRTVSPVPSQPEPAAGSDLAVCMFIDVTNELKSLGSYGIILNWDNTVLEFEDAVGGDPPFDSPVFNLDLVDLGTLHFSDADPVGAPGVNQVACFEFAVVGESQSATDLSIGLTSLFSAGDFVDLKGAAFVVPRPIRVQRVCDVGDVNQDAATNSGDALMILSYEAGFELPPDADLNVQGRCGDLNVDGATNATDANIALSWEIGIEVDPTFPIGDPNVTYDYCPVCVEAPAAKCGASQPARTGAGVATPRLSIASGRARGPFVVEVAVDLSQSGNALGSYGAELSWDPGRYAVVEVFGGSGVFSAPVVNRAASASGRIRFADAAPDGARGDVPILRALFVPVVRRVDEPPRSDDFRLTFSSMATPGPGFDDLLPALRP